MGESRFIKGKTHNLLHILLVQRHVYSLPCNFYVSQRVTISASSPLSRFTDPKVLVSRSYQVRRYFLVRDPCVRQSRGWRSVTRYLYLDGYEYRYCVTDLTREKVKHNLLCFLVENQS